MEQYSPVRYRTSDRYSPMPNVYLHRKRRRHRVDIHPVSREHRLFCRLQLATLFCHLLRNRKTDPPFCRRRIYLHVSDKPRGSKVPVVMIGYTRPFVFVIAEGGFACLVPILVVSDPRSVLLTVNVVPFAPLISVRVVSDPIAVLLAINHFAISE